MDLCDVRQVEALLSRHGFHFSKSKGQNFLTAAWVPERIAESCGADRLCGVVEIGPGFGCLTEQLSLRAGRVLAYEVDGVLRPVLAETLAGRDNVEIVFDDVMRRDLAADIRERLPGLRPLLCANLPYNITSPVLTKLLESGCFEMLTVMVQKEVAERIAARPATPQYGAFSILAQWYAEPELLFTVGAECFVPRPKVTSAVVRLKRRPAPPVETDEKSFFRVVRAAFNMRRKTLINALDGLCGRETALAAVRACGFDERVRGEALSLADFAALTNAIEKLK